MGVLRSFLDTDPRSFLLRLEAQRPPAITPESKGRILEGVPKEGRVTNLSPSARSKLASLEPVLRAHQRDSVYDVMVIAIPQAYTGLHARAVVLISEPALDLLEVSELQAVVTHEIGHEYVWAEYEQARQSRNHERLRELELYCDGIAILTMRRLGADPLCLIRGLEKIARGNQQFGRARNEDRYPSLQERRQFAEAIARWARGAGTR